MIRVPLDQALEAELDDQEEARGRLARRGARCSAPTTASTCRSRPSAPARSATRSSSEAQRRGADLIVVGSAPRWRRQSRFFSPTVDYVLRKAPCEVLVVAFPRA